MFKDLTGITSILNYDYRDISNIKKYLLLFDSIGIIDLKKRILDERQSHTHNHFCETLIVCEELDQLFNQKLLHDIELKGGVGVRKEDATPDNIKLFYTLLENSQKMFDDPHIDAQIKFDAFNRLQSFMLNVEDPPNSFESIPILKQLTLPFNLVVQKSEVVNLVINQFPIPSENVPLEQLLEYKSDTDNLGRLAGLRTWINKFSKSGLTLNEIKDELEYKIFQYQKSLDTHKIKYNNGMIETFIVGGAEFLENILKLKLKNIAKSLFQAKKLKADLMLAEANSQGHELGYIYKLNKDFKN